MRASTSGEVVEWYLEFGRLLCVFKHIAVYANSFCLSTVYIEVVFKWLGRHLGVGGVISQCSKCDSVCTKAPTCICYFFYLSRIFPMLFGNLLSLG